MTDSPTVDPREYRDTIGLFATGVTVVTSGSGDDIHAMTANAITSLSLDPILLIFCVRKDARMTAYIERNQSFTVNILSAAQEELSNYFAGFGDEENPPAFTFVDWHGSARLAGSNAALHCEVHTRHDGGDHWIAVGRVVDLHRPNGKSAPPLIYYRGRYEALAAYTDLPS